MLSKTCPACGKGPVVYDNGFERCENCSVYKTKLPFYKQPLLWAEGRLWWPRALVFLFMAWTASRYMSLQDYAIDRGANIINMLDLGMHELGHVLFRPFGEFMTILGGSLFQCLFALAWVFACWWKRWYFAASMCLVWVGFNLHDVAAYAADANARLFPLATFNNDYDSAHDWYQILTRLGQLENDLAIAATIRTAGTICIFAGLALGIALIGWMLRSGIVAKDKMPENSPQP